MRVAERSPRRPKEVKKKWINRSVVHSIAPSQVKFRSSFLSCEATPGSCSWVMLRQLGPGPLQQHCPGQRHPASICTFRWKPAANVSGKLFHFNKRSLNRLHWANYSHVLSLSLTRCLLCFCLDHEKWQQFCVSLWWQVHAGTIW